MADWRHLEGIEPQKFLCPYCSTLTGNSRGFRTEKPPHRYIYICANCDQPSYLDAAKKWWPGAAIGEQVSDLPAGINELYEEARRCGQVSAYTSIVLACRKILMHVAVEKGADKNKTFAYYVDWLCDNHFVPAEAKDWVDHIRSKGNEANHEIVAFTTEDAEEIMTLTSMLLKLNYEFKARMLKKKPASPAKP